MSLGWHSEVLVNLLLLWESNVHAKLGYFPTQLREICHAEVVGFLGKVEQALGEETCAVQAAAGRLECPSSTHNERKPVTC